MKTIFNEQEVSEKLEQAKRMSNEVYEIYDRVKAIQVVYGSNEVIDRMVKQAFDIWEEYDKEIKYWNAVKLLNESD